MNKIDLNGNFAVVTGAARGIGYAIVERLLDSGAACCLWDKDVSALTERVKRANVELWRWIAAAALAFLLFEWWFYHKRTA